MSARASEAAQASRRGRDFLHHAAAPPTASGYRLAGNFMTSPPLILTLTTDFGLTDTFVSQMKAVILTAAPQTIIVDNTHGIPPQDVFAGSLALWSALRVYPPGTIHLAIVDPGVGTDRRIVLARCRDQIIVCPDNGLLTWAALDESVTCHGIRWRPAEASPTFNGRDIFAPVVARLCAGVVPETLIDEPVDPVRLERIVADGEAGRIIAYDHFGNAMTNFTSAGAVQVKVLAQPMADLALPCRRTYADVGVGEPIAYLGSAGLIELAIRDGSFRDRFKLPVGTEVRRT
jgi:S-adenosyl-L-methionine hydrolase (adenosine-forming)